MVEHIMQGLLRSSSLTASLLSLCPKIICIAVWKVS